MKILVTGAAGFIGSYVSRQLNLEGHDVIGIDNFNDYYARNCKEFNVDLNYLWSNQEPKTQQKTELLPVLERLKTYYSYSTAKQLGSFKFIECDIRDYTKLKEIFEIELFEGVIHLAAMAGVPYSTKEPRLYSEVNVDGTTNLLDLAQRNGANRFLFGSSSSVYGNREDSKVKETDDISKPRSLYGATKVSGEVLCHSFNVLHGMNIAVCRIFGPIYGPLQRPYGMVQQRLINFIHNKKTFQVYGKYGLDTAKDSTFIDDEVSGLLSAFMKVEGFDTFNIGTSDPYPLKDWIAALEELTGEKLNYEVVESDIADVVSSADISYAKEKLGYEPKTHFKEGLRKQIEIFKLMPAWYRTMDRV